MMKQNLLTAIFILSMVLESGISVNQDPGKAPDKKIVWTLRSCKEPFNLGL